MNFFKKFTKDIPALKALIWALLLSYFALILLIGFQYNKYNVNHEPMKVEQQDNVKSN